MVREHLPLILEPLTLRDTQKIKHHRLVVAHLGEHALRVPFQPRADNPTENIQITPPVAKPAHPADPDPVPLLLIRRGDVRPITSMKIIGEHVNPVVPLGN